MQATATQAIRIGASVAAGLAVGIGCGIVADHDARDNPGQKGFEIPALVPVGLVAAAGSVALALTPPRARPAVAGVVAAAGTTEIGLLLALGRRCNM